jgi:hypothetical protein
VKRIWLISILAGAALHAAAMDRYAALSMLESNDNDSKIGASGEVSRYQIRPDVWRAYSHGQTLSRTHALCVARAIMHDRMRIFASSHHRAPSDFEFYVLWNAPAQIDAPDKTVADRAQRFANLCSLK